MKYSLEPSSPWFCVLLRLNNKDSSTPSLMPQPNKTLDIFILLKLATVKFQSVIKNSLITLSSQL